jgi:uncharacterized protein (TIGR04255 family)
MYDAVCYKNTFLKEVIFKADFPTLVQGVEKGLSAKVSKAILGKFPLSEPQKAHAQEFQFSGGSNFQAKSSEIMQWIFHSQNRDRTLAITQEAFSYTSREYKTYETLVEDINAPIKEFFSDYKDLTSSRLGLRYVNVIEIEEGHPLEWKDYLNEDMLGIIDFNQDKEFLTRMFHILEYNFEGLLIKFQFGIANPDYPAPVRKKQFVLDIDAYSQGAFEYSDIADFVTQAHKKIQSLFEMSITNKTRELMRPA